MMKYLISFVFITFFGSNLLQSQCYDCDSKAFLGIYSDGISKKKAKKLQFDNIEGSYITGVIGNTAADKAGFKPFDYIYGIDEYRTNSDRSLTSILRKYEPGDLVVVHFYRNGKTEKANLTLGKRSDADYHKRSKREDPFLGVEQSHRSIDWDINGVRINVVNNSSASAIGLEDGDIIIHINDHPILDWNDMSSAIDMMTVGDDMKVVYLRSGKEYNVNGEVKSLAETKSHTYSSSSHYDSDDDENDAFNFNFNFNFDDDDDDNRIRNGDDRYEVERRNVDGMVVELGDISSSDSERMRDQHNINMQVSNSLTIDKLNLSPNPNIGLFELTFDLPSKGNTSINIYNEEGRNIYNYDLGSYSGSFEDRIDISQNGTGIYFLQITQGDKSMAKKVVLRKR